MAFSCDLMTYVGFTYYLKMFSPDMTFKVDWALNMQNQSMNSLF